MRNYGREQTMITKEEITIKVPFEVAEAYRNATEEEREQLQLKIAAIMQSQFTTKRKEAIARLRNTMDKASQEAQERGLTPEILESILSNDE
jgi:glycerate-2-kinase